MKRGTVTELLAARVRRLRTERGWSAQQLADACLRAGFSSLTRSTIAKIESGTRKSVTADEVTALAHALGVTPTDLLATPAWLGGSADAPAAHRTIMVVDVANFTSRSIVHQADIREGLYAVLGESFSEAGIDLAACTTEDRGDGAMILLPAEFPKTALVTRFPATLAAALGRRNRTRVLEAGIQLRVGLHAGDVWQEASGVVGQAANLAFRLLNAQEAKSALRLTSSVLALVMSDPFYQDVVRQDPAAEPDSYRPIEVSVKGTDTKAWLRLFGEATLPDRREVGVPAIWGNVPLRNPNFTGREALLDNLGNRLAESGGPVVVSALHGMGGVGKTQLAVEYAYRRLNRYDLVWWIQATQPPQIRAGLTQLAQQLNLPGATEAHTAVPAVLEALRLGQPYRRWLLVFDAAESPDVVRPFLPANGPGEIVITSRNPGWFEIARPIEVDLFRREESIELLRRRGVQGDAGEAEPLAEALGDLPLAVDQAAAWLVETGMTIHEYLRMFTEKVAEILSAPEPGDYVGSVVSAAWNLSFDELQNRNPVAYQILQICAFFAPEPISRGILAPIGWASVSPEMDAALRDPMQVGRAIRDINRFGLAKVDHHRGALVLHRLVQLMLRSRMGPSVWQDMRHAAHLLLANHDPNSPSLSDTWSYYREVLPHMTASEAVTCDDPRVRQLVINVIQYLYFGGYHDEAARLARQALDRWSERSGETDPYTLQAATYLGLCLWALGRFTESAEINSRTLELRGQVSGGNEKEAIVSELLVALDTKTRGDFVPARKIGERLYRKARELFGDDDPITLQAAHDLAATVRLCGDYQRAQELDEFTYRRRAEILGPDSLDTLNTFGAMLIDQRELGDYRRARLEQERFAARIRGMLGEDKADSLRRLADLAVSRRKDGDHAGALALSAEVLTLYRRRYGDEHPDVMVCALGHSINLRYARELGEALELGNETLNRYRNVLGEGHPHTLAAQVDLAITRRLYGDAAGAQRLTDSALKQLRAVLGADHPNSIACAIAMASDLAALGDLKGARDTGQDALRRARRMLDDDHPIALAATLNLAIDSSAGATLNAEVQLADLLSRYRRVLGEDHPATAAARAGTRVDCDIDPLPL